MIRFFARGSSSHYLSSSAWSISILPNANAKYSQRISSFWRYSYLLAACTTWSIPRVLQVPVVSAFSTTATTAATATATATTTATTMGMPKAPYPFRNTAADNKNANANDFSLQELGMQIQASETERQQAFDVSRKISQELLQVSASLETPNKGAGAGAGAGAETETETETETDDRLEQTQALLMDAVGTTTASRIPRSANLSNRVEGFVELLAMQHFLQTAQLLPPVALALATDEEYLAALMALCQSLARYGMGRAIDRDVDSVTAARNLVQGILTFLLQLDFRNGYLRRKYDGCKYALKRLETILYELSVTGGATATMTAQQEELQPTFKKFKPMDPMEPISPATAQQLELIQQRMEERDALRESLIKKCRDGQKAAKQAIFALHRGDLEKAHTLLQNCETCITQELLPITQQEPPLRAGGSFGQVLEEYVEAKLFATWLHGHQETPKRTLLQIQDFDQFHLEPSEYLGGLCDLTGEIGRYAVQQGTLRNLAGVKQCLETNANILLAIQSMDLQRSPIYKKMEMIKRSVEKLERMLYEMSLSEATGGRQLEHTMEDDAGADKNDKNKSND